MLTRPNAVRTPVAPCARVAAGHCLGCPKCLRTGRVLGQPEPKSSAT